MSGASAGTTTTPSYRELATDSKFLPLTVASYIGMFNVTVVSPAIPALARAFSLPDAQVGLIMSVYTLPGIVFVLVVGNLADLYGKITALVFSLAMFGIAGSVVAAVNLFVALLAFRVLQGVGAAALQPLITALIGDLYDGVTASAAHGIRASVNGLSMLVMPVLVGFILTYSWRYVFLLNAVAVVAAVGVYLFVPEHTPSRQSDGTETSFRSAFVDQTKSTVAELRNSEKAVLVLGGFARGFAIFAILTFVPLFADRAFAATSISIGLIVGMRGAARVVVAPFSGVLLARLSHRVALILAVTISAGSALALLVAPNLLWVGALVGLYSIGDSIFFPVFMDALTTTASDRSRAGVTSAASFFRKIGTTISPVVFGVVLAVAGFAPIFVVTAAVLLAYGALVAVYVAV